MPVVAIREVGKGRSMAVLTDSTWHWSFLAGNRGGDPRHYRSFWSNAIRWLIQDPAMDLVQVKVLEERVSVGAVARAHVKVSRPDYRPASGEDVDVIVRRRLEGGAPGEGEVVQRSQGLKCDVEGTLEVEIPLEKAGIYEVEARAEVVPGRQATSVDLWVATARSRELEQVVGDGRLMELLAEASGGAVQSLRAEEPRLESRPPRVSRVLSRQHHDLWNQPWVILGLVGLLGTEWWLRRQYGFL